MGKSAFKALERFRNDRSGMALIYVTIALPAIIGMALLAVDLGRVTSLESSLAHGADALALAGAGELDRRPDAIVRANRAIANLITSNQNIFGTTVVTIDASAVSTRYLATLPANDSIAITASNVTTDPVQARFVEVAVTPQNFNTIFPATFLGAASNARTATATAVAGFDSAVCNFTPLFMCNPFEPTTGVTDVFADYGLYSHISTTANKRRQIALKAHSQGSQWSPGNYGFLEANAGPGAKALGDAVASTNPGFCFIQNGIYTKPGNTTVTKNAFNVRFDLYDSSYKKTDYPPGVNVRKGYIVKRTSGNGQSNACDHNNPLSAFNPADYTLTNGGVMSLPRDSCFATNSCSLSGGRMGNGDWSGNFEQYWATVSGTVPTSPCGGSACTNSNLPTRYDIYRYEIAQNLTGQSRGYATFTTGNGNGGGAAVNYYETGTPACSTLAPVDNPDRRIIYGALLNCRAAGLSSGAGGPYQALAFGKFFMTEPMGDPPDSTLWTELVEVVEPGQANSVARDIVQLYR